MVRRGEKIRSLFSSGRGFDNNRSRQRRPSGRRPSPNAVLIVAAAPPRRTVSLCDEESFGPAMPWSIAARHSAGPSVIPSSEENKENGSWYCPILQGRDSDRAVHGGSMWMSFVADAGNPLYTAAVGRAVSEVSDWTPTVWLTCTPPAHGLVLRLRLLRSTRTRRMTRTSHLQAP